MVDHSDGVVYGFVMKEQCPNVCLGVCVYRFVSMEILDVCHRRSKKMIFRGCRKFSLRLSIHTNGTIIGGKPLVRAKK
jgi:hypothetical protein